MLGVIAPLSDFRMLLLRIGIAPIVFLIASGCATDEGPPDQLQLAISECIAAQIGIGNADWDSESGRPRQADMDRVKAIVHPAADSFVVAISASDIYPDASTSWCEIGKESGAVLLAAYSNGDGARVEVLDEGDWDTRADSDGALATEYSLSDFLE